MTLDPFQRFLGVSASAGPFELLGLAPDRAEPSMIEAALRTRLAKVFNHPDGRSVEAEMVRTALREAARRLREPGQGRQVLAATGGPAPATRAPGEAPTSQPATHGPANGPANRPATRDAARRRRLFPLRAWSRAIATKSPAGPRPTMTLTEFDRHVLAALVACGGWNARSRAMLVSLAAAHNITVHGLIRVIVGLGDYARAGGARLGVAEITAGASRVVPPSSTSDSIDTTAAWLARVAPELSDDSPWAAVKLSALFVVLVAIAAVLALPVLFRSSPTPEATTNEQIIVPEVVTDDSEAPEVNETDATEPPPRLAAFDSPPTFDAMPPPAGAAAAADRASELPAGLDNVGRRIAISAEPSDAVYRDWDAFLEQASIAWPLMDEPTTAAVRRAIIDTLISASDSPSVSDRLLSNFVAPAAPLTEPLDVWRGAWRAGMLADIARNPLVSTAVIERARGHLDASLANPSAATIADFTAAAGAWLDRAAALLVERTDADDGAYERWQLWITAVTALHDDELLNASLVRAIELLLRTRVDLSRPSVSVDVLGRLLSLADFQSSAVVRDAFYSWFEDVEGIQSTDLWVAGSILVLRRELPWYSADLVLPADASEITRRRFADRTMSAWPGIIEPHEDHAPAGRGLAVDPERASRWVGLLDQSLRQRIVPDSNQYMRKLLLASYLNEAAALLAAGRRDEADSALAQASSALEDRDVAPSPPARIIPPGTPVQVTTQTGQVFEIDGVWAQAYSDLGRDAEERMNQLRVLRRTAGRDLGPIDAALLVREAYRASPREVRELALSIVVEVFSNGPNIAMQMLDQFPGSAASPALSTAIQSLAGRVLPPASSADWRREARLALLEHAIALRASRADAVDEMARLLAGSCAIQIEALDSSRSGVNSRTAHEAAAAMVQALRDAASSLMVAQPVPDTLEALDQRHATRLRLASGPLQQFVAHRLTALELLTYITVAEQPAMRRQAAGILTDAAEARRAMEHVLQQAMSIEQTMNRVWQIRMNAAVSESVPPDDAGLDDQPEADAS